MQTLDRVFWAHPSATIPLGLRFGNIGGNFAGALISSCESKYCRALPLEMIALNAMSVAPRRSDPKADMFQRPFAIR